MKLTVINDMKVLEKEGITFSNGTIKPSVNNWFVR